MVLLCVGPAGSKVMLIYVGDLPALEGLGHPPTDFGGKRRAKPYKAHPL